MPHIHRMSAIELAEGLPLDALIILRAIANLAAEHHARIALVGGVVRDLALDIPLDRDLDVVVEGDVPSLAKKLAETLGGSVAASYGAFGTATVALPPKPESARIRYIDLAQARAEIYVAPGALPTVTPATLDADLQRRDFSINSVALEVDCAALSAGASINEAVRLLDPFGGLEDLRLGLLRVLHPDSFRDDPTRILRGLRLAARLGLHFDDEARALIEQELAIGGLAAISPDRVRNELCLALEEPRPELALRLSDSLNVTSQLVPSLAFTPALAARMDVVRYELLDSTKGQGSLLALGLLTYDLLPGDRERLIRRYRLPKEAMRLLRDVAGIQQVRGVLGTPTLPTSHLDTLLQPWSDIALRVVCIAESGTVAEAVKRYLLEVRAIQPLLSGRDLLALGIHPGPQVGALLTDLRAAQLDGRIRTRDEAEEWVRRESGDVKYET